MLPAQEITTLTEKTNMILIDINGERWKLHERLRANPRNDIRPNHSQMNLSYEEEDQPSTALTMPDDIADRWIKGEIKVKVIPTVRGPQVKLI